MKTLFHATAAAGLLALAACGGNADDRAEENIEAMTENRVDALEAQADAAPNEQMEEALEEKADRVEERGEEAAERADDNDDARVENAFRNSL